MPTAMYVIPSLIWCIPCFTYMYLCKLLYATCQFRGTLYIVSSFVYDVLKVLSALHQFHSCYINFNTCYIIIDVWYVEICACWITIHLYYTTISIFVVFVFVFSHCC